MDEAKVSQEVCGEVRSPKSKSGALTTRPPFLLTPTYSPQCAIVKKGNRMVGCLKNGAENNSTSIRIS